MCLAKNLTSLVEKLSQLLITCKYTQNIRISKIEYLIIPNLQISNKKSYTPLNNLFFRLLLLKHYSLSNLSFYWKNFCIGPEKSFCMYYFAYRTT